MATAKQQSIRLAAEDVAILEEIQRRTGLFGLSDAIRYAIRQYAELASVDPAKPKPKPKRKR